MTTFLSLHRSERGFVMPNAWDAGSAVLLAAAGFPAIATTSAGVAFSLARPDHGSTTSSQRVPRDVMLERARSIVEAVGIPVNGDLEDGYGVSPEAVAETITAAIELGLAGANIEDWSNGGLLDQKLAVERIVAAREAIGTAPFVLTARTDGAQLSPPAPLSSIIARAQLLQAAGADCLFTPGVASLDDIATEVRELGDAPLNVVLGLSGTGLTVPALLDVGVRRISLGGTFARAALGFIRDGARELAERGTISFAEGQIPQRELNETFLRAGRDSNPQPSDP